MEQQPQRDASGRFLPGCSLGRENGHKGGNPRLRALAAHQAAIRDAVKPDDVVEVLAALKTKALAGDVGACCAWLQRVLGKPRNEPVGAIELPDISTPSGINEALRLVACAIAAGELPPEEANGVLAAIRASVDVTLLESIEQKLARVERKGEP